jgi:peptide/nickel transport system permease protein
MRHASGWTRAAGAVLLVIVLASLGAGLAPHDRDAVHLESRHQAPSWAHPLGTDDLGRDTLARLLHAGRVSLGVALLATCVALLLGTALGATAGYCGGRIDTLISALIDVALAVPFFFVLLVLAAHAGGSAFWLCALIGGFTWMPVARLVRAATLTLRERDFVQAARALGMTHRRIVVRHILPNATAPILVSATLGAAQAILLESALGFLGFGVQPPVPTWGNMLRQSQAALEIAPWNAVFPGAFLFVTILALHVLADHARDRLDPHLRAGRG